MDAFPDQKHRLEEVCEVQERREEEGEDEVSAKANAAQGVDEEEEDKHEGVVEDEEEGEEEETIGGASAGTQAKVTDEKEVHEEENAVEPIRATDEHHENKQGDVDEFARVHRDVKNDELEKK